MSIWSRLLQIGETEADKLATPRCMCSRSGGCGKAGRCGGGRKRATAATVWHLIAVALPVPTSAMSADQPCDGVYLARHVQKWLCGACKAAAATHMPTSRSGACGKAGRCGNGANSESLPTG